MEILIAANSGPDASLPTADALNPYRGRPKTAAIKVKARDLAAALGIKAPAPER